MQDSFNELLNSWIRSESESRIAMVNRSLIPPVSNALVFRFVSRKVIGIKDLESALNAIWRPSSPATVYSVGEGIFLVAFEGAADCNRVLAKQPWLLSNTLTIFKKAIGKESRI